MCLALLQGRKGETPGEVCCFLPGFSALSMAGRRLRVVPLWMEDDSGGALLCTKDGFGRGGG